MTINNALIAEIFLRECRKTLKVVLTYYQLSMLDSLSEEQTVRVVEILHIAEGDPLLSFLLDEADHIIGHKQGFIDVHKLQEEQEILRHQVDRTWLLFLIRGSKEENENCQT